MMSGVFSGSMRMPNTSELAPPDWLTIFRVPELREPTGLSVLGNYLFVADHTLNAILRFDWVIPTPADEAAAGPSDTAAATRSRCLSSSARFAPKTRKNRLNLPHGILALDSGILVADTSNHRLLKLNHKLGVVDTYTDFGGKALCRPHAVDSNVPGECFIADTDNGRLVRLIGGDGEPLPMKGLQMPLQKPCGLCLSPSRILIADTFNHRLVVTDRDGTLVRTYGAEGREVGMFRYPVAVASWQHWFVVSDEYNKRLQLWRTDEEGGYWTATCVSSNLCSPWLGKPFGLAFNPDGRLFIADRAQAQILMVDFEGMLAASFDDVE
jgi:hypothetical protein